MLTTALGVLGVLVALFLAAALATREDQALAPAPPDAADVVLPARIGAGDVRGLRFGLAARGYRMSEVDAALERLAVTLEERDRRIADLTGDAPAADGVVEVDGIATAGLQGAGAGTDPLLPFVAAPGQVAPTPTGSAALANGAAPDVAHGDAEDVAHGAAPDVAGGHVSGEPVDRPRASADPPGRAGTARPR